MERKPISSYIDHITKNNSYYKSKIYKRKQLQQSNYSINKSSKNNFKNNKIKPYNNNKLKLSNIDYFKTKKDKPKPFNTNNININKNKVYAQKKAYIRNKILYYDLGKIILIQKRVRGFLTRKRLKKRKKNRKCQSLNFQEKINIFEAIKRNSKIQKDAIKMANNRINIRNTVYCKNIPSKVFKQYKSLKTELSKKKNSSFDENAIKKIICENDFYEKIINKEYQDKDINSKKNENQSSIPETEFTLSNAFNEQSPLVVEKKLKNNNKQPCLTEGMILSKNLNLCLESPQGTTSREGVEKNKNKKTNKKEKNSIEVSIDNACGDEFDSEMNYQENKNKINSIKSNIKYNFNPLANRKLNFDFCANKRIFEFGAIKEEKRDDFDNELQSLKSSFYDENEFVIINYDYRLNDKKKKEDTFKLVKAENLNFDGSCVKSAKFFDAIRKIIIRRMKIYVFDLMKKFKNDDDDDDKSVTDNESCSNIQQGRIKRNKMMFNFAQNFLL